MWTGEGVTPHTSGPQENSAKRVTQLLCSRQHTLCAFLILLDPGPLAAHPLALGRQRPTRPTMGHWEAVVAAIYWAQNHADNVHFPETS